MLAPFYAEAARGAVRLPKTALGTFTKIEPEVVEGALKGATLVDKGAFKSDGPGWSESRLVSR